MESVEHTTKILGVAETQAPSSLFQLSEYLTNAVVRLRQAGLEEPQIDVRWLACHVLKLDRAQLLSQAKRILSSEEISALNDVMSRRAQREPVGRIIGQREFWGLNFGLNEATLEPRPDSETLVDTVLAAFKERNRPLRILDLGTGTGCLLLALLHELPQANGLGIDLNPRAVEQATLNAEALLLNRRACFRIGHWLDGIEEKFDIIVSNPPYIPATDIINLMPEVRVFDPLLALDGGADGLTPYRLMIPSLAALLNPKGLAAFEVGQGQSLQVAELFGQNGFVSIALHKDLGGIERCVTAMTPSL
jgi:release factor glutamine methyltransferase